jgi:formylglycine-generating enzyme required for sulfatase activity
MLLVLLAFSVYAADETLVAVGSAKELKGITAKKIIWKKDEAKMVRIPYEVVTPAKTKPAVYDEFGDLVKAETVIPEKIKSSPFYMDAYEVTIGQFKKFLKSSGYKPDDAIDWNEVYEYSPTEKHPMIYVSWHDATAYAKWAEKRLPTGKEWEWAARGGLKNKEYSWGDNESLARDYANYDGTGGEDKWEYCAPVGSFKPNGYGLFDMAGNVYEWCQDWYDSDQDERVIRGGYWNSNSDGLQVAYRYYLIPSLRNYDFGFRCVSGLP